MAILRSQGILLMMCAGLVCLAMGCHSMGGPQSINQYGVHDQLVRGQSPEGGDVFKAEDTVAKIVIEGNRTIPASSILPKLTMRAEAPVQGSEPKIRLDMKALYETGWFHSVEARYRRTEQGILLVYVVEERPIIQKVEYRGNRKIKTRTLQNLTGLVPGHAFSVGINKEAVRRIREYYREKGYRFAEVTLIKGANLCDREVVFEINEGPKVKIKSIGFEGNTILSDRVLELKIISKRERLMFLGGDYDPSTITDDVAALKQFYHLLGYFDVSVREEILLSEDKSSVRLEFHINEGVRYKIRSIQFDGNEALTTAFLSQELEVSAGDLYHRTPINKDLGKVTKLYGSAGRLFTKVEAVPVFSGQEGICDLVYKIKEDNVRYIGRINVNIRDDNAYTRETLVLNQLLFAPGELADPEMIRRSQRRLERSPIWQGAGPMAPNINLKPAEGAQFARVEVPKEYYLGQSPVIEEMTRALLKSHTPHEVPVINTVEIVERETNENKQTKQVIPAAYKVKQEQEQNNSPIIAHGWNLPRGSLKTTNRHELNGSFENVQNQFHSLEQFDPQQFNIPNSGESTSLLETENPKESSTFNSSPQTSANPVQAKVPSLEQTLLNGLSQVEDLFLSEPNGFINADFNVKKPKQQGNPVDSLVTNFDKAETIIRGQSFDATGNPPNPVFNNTPQGDIFGQQLRNPEPPAFVDVDVGLNQQQTGRFMFSVGVNSDAGVVGSIVLEEQNFSIMEFPRSFSDIGPGTFRGNGEQFRIEAVPGNQVSRYVVSWTNPFFMGTNYSLSLSGFYYNRFFESYEERRLGGRVQVGTLLPQSRFLSANVAVRLEDVTVANPQTLLVDDLNEVTGSNFLGTVRPSIAWDTRDSPFMPSEGTFVEGAVEQAFGDFTFTKFELSAKKYFKAYERIDGAGRHVIALSGSVGYTTDNTPLFERYYAGGVQTFRGFRFRGVTPRVGTTPTGGFWQALGSTEYILPVTAAENIRLIAFSDFGTVDEDVSLDKFRVSVGGGMRITIPQMGPVPIALDWAVPLVRENRDQTRLFQFYIGFTR